MELKLDLIWLIRTYWPDRIRPALKSELQDIAEEYDVSTQEVLHAVLECMADDDNERD